MIKTFALIVSIAIAAAAPGADDTAKKLSTVSVSSKGHDVRAVLHDMFKQTGKSFVLEPNIRFGLFLSLEKVEFEEALRLVCRTASLEIDVQNGIYFISKAKPPVIVPLSPTVKGAFETKPKGRLPETVLNKRVTTRFEKTEIRALMAELAKQTSLTIEVDSEIPALKLDAYLIGTSLKFALDTICSAAKIQYRFTDTLSIQIYKPTPTNRVAVIGN